VRVAFLGTPEVAVPALDALVAADDVEVVAVLTNPDRPKGRSRTPVPPPVKVAAEAHGLPVWQPVKPREVLDDLLALELDAAAVVAYGALLPRDVLDAGGRGFVNLHFSLLPRWRGAAPVQHAIRAGDTSRGSPPSCSRRAWTPARSSSRSGSRSNPTSPPVRLLTRLAGDRRADAGVLPACARRRDRPDPAARGRGHAGAQDHPRRRRHRLDAARGPHRRPVPQRGPGAPARTRPSAGSG
jgi:hypothetical protein